MFQPPTPRPGQTFRFKQNHFIDSHKAATGLFVLLLIVLFDRWTSPTAWVYLALHGTYGLLWATKSRLFPDKAWEQPVPLWYGLFNWAALSCYWIAPVILVAGDVTVPAWGLAGCITLYTVGVCLHFGADLHKSVALKLRPGVLITDGLWALCRNPNYLGELLIYLGFGLLARHWLPPLVIALYVGLYWLPNMRRKDRSLSRYPEFAAYKARTKLFIPYVW